MIISKGFGYLFAVSALISIVVFSCSFSVSAQEPRYGVHVLDFNIREGRVKVFLPDDMAAGDTVSAYIGVYPSGNSPEARENNARILNSFTVETSFDSTPVGAGFFKLHIPMNTAGTLLMFSLRDQSSREFVSSSVPVKLSPPSRGRGEVPTPFDYQCPLVGQAGRLIEIKGPFDGDFGTTDFQIGNKKAQVLAESPRKLVFETPADVAGSVDLVLKEREVVVKRPFTCLQVVKIGQEGAVPVSAPVREEVMVGETPPETGKSGYSDAGIKEEEYSGPTQRLEFESIKTEETLTPVRQNQTSAQIADARPHTDQVSVILADQMSAPFEGSTIITEQLTVSETVIAAETGEPDSPVISEEGIEELSYEAIAGSEEAVTTEPGEVREALSLSEESHLPSGPADNGLKAGIIESQLLASFTGAVSNNGSNVLPSASRHEGHFTVQVASFKTEEDAEKLAGKLGSKGYPVFVVAADIPGKGKWYRVRVGDFGTKHEAGTFSDYLRKKEPLVTSVFVAEND